MVKNIIRLYVFCFTLLFLSACTEQTKNNTLTIAVASNYESTLKKIVKHYKITHKDVKIELVAASSGTLANQIINHAPFDLFLSADTAKPSYIFDKLKLKTPPQVYAAGLLALWIPHSSGEKCLSKLSEIKTLAMANPKTAPYGKTAKNILKENKIKTTKIIQTSNAVQAFIYTQQGLTESGFVPYSMLINTDFNGCLQVFENKVIHQSSILLNNKAAEFYHYLFSAQVKQINKKSGYL